VLAGRVTWVQEWLGGPVAGARLVVLTGVRWRPGPGIWSAGWRGGGGGLVRSVQAEGLGQVILADLPAHPDGRGSAAGRGAQGREPELAIQDGQLYGRQLARPVRAGSALEARRAGGRPAGTVQDRWDRAGRADARHLADGAGCGVRAGLAVRPGSAGARCWPRI
jgi:hypothetical protein